jgi:nucleoside-diphosphate-sugar epimerase
MPRALIAGCGYLGGALAELLTVDGWDVEGWTMSLESAGELSARPYPVRAVDISNADQVSGRKGDFGAVIHCASTRGGNVERYREVYLNGARNLVRRFRSARILFTSSTSVYAQTNGEWVTEESATEPQHERGQVLRETEKLVLSNDGIVVRLGGIYGPGRSGLLRKFLDNELLIEGDRFVNQVHRDDAAAALRLLIDQRFPYGTVFNVVDNDPTLLSDCYRWLARKLELSRLPSIESTSSRKRGGSNKRVSNAKLRRLGWRPQYSNFVAGMEKSVLPSFGSGGLSERPASD